MSDCRPPDARAGGAPVPPLGSQVWRRRAPNLKARGRRHKARGLHLAGVPTSSQVANHRHLRARNAASRRPGRMAVAGDLRGKPPTGEGSAAELGETIARVSQAAPHQPSRARAGAGEGQSHRPFKKGRGQLRAREGMSRRRPSPAPARASPAAPASAEGGQGRLTRRRETAPANMALWRASAGARGRRPPTPRGQAPGSGARGRRRRCRHRGREGRAMRCTPTRAGQRWPPWARPRA